MTEPERSSRSFDEELRRRSRRGFLTLGAGALLGVGGWKWLMSRESADGIPWPLRKMFLWNERVSRAFFKIDRVGASPEVPATGTPIRLNGDLGLAGTVSLSEWKLRLGPPSQIKELSLAEIRALPRTEAVTRFRCIEGWSEEFAYAGVRFSDFARHYGMDPLPYVGLATPDREYYVSLDRESMIHPQTLLAYEMNGVPLSDRHGAPLRLVIPVKYGIKSLKRIGHLWVSEARPPDYWAERGYDWYSGL